MKGVQQLILMRIVTNPGKVIFVVVACFYFTLGD